MTADEFQKKYHDYHTSDEMEALADAVKVNSQMTDGTKVAPVKLGEEYCLMLATAAAYIAPMGL